MTISLNFSYLDLDAKETSVSTAEKVAKIFQKHTSNYYMEYEGGRRLKVHFSNFPTLDIYYYDATYGEGAAKKVLEDYNKIPADQRFDKNDTYRFSDLTKK